MNNSFAEIAVVTIGWFSISSLGSIIMSIEASTCTVGFAIEVDPAFALKKRYSRRTLNVGAVLITFWMIKVISYGSGIVTEGSKIATGRSTPLRISNIDVTKTGELWPICVPIPKVWNVSIFLPDSFTMSYDLAVITLGAFVYPDPGLVSTISTIWPPVTTTSALAPPPVWSTETKCKIGGVS